MKLSLYVTALVFCLLICSSLFGQSMDSLAQDVSVEQIDSVSYGSGEFSGYDNSNDVSPAMLIIIFFCIIIFLASTSFGIVLATLAILLLIGLVLLGVLSTSVIVWLNKKSFSAGVRIFIILTFAMGGLLIGVTTFWLLNLIVHWYSTAVAIVLGATCGAFSGGATGAAVHSILKRLLIYGRQKLNLSVV